MERKNGEEYRIVFDISNPAMNQATSVTTIESEHGVRTIHDNGLTPAG